MATIEQENAQLEQQIAALESMLTQEPQAQQDYTLGQLGLDIPLGALRAGAGLADIVSYPVVKGLEYAGAPVETFGTSKIVEALANKYAPQYGLQPQTEVQKAVEFMTPLPGPGKARIAGDIAFGGLGYLGSKLGEEISPDSRLGQVATTLAVPLLTGAGYAGAKKLAQAAAPTAGLVLGTEKGLQQAAQAEVLNKLGSEGLARLEVAQQLPELMTGTGGVPLTAAEIAQTPSAAKYQQLILATPTGGDILQKALTDRATNIAAGLESLGVTPQVGELQTALRDAAVVGEAQKAAQQQTLLSSLGATPDVLAQTKTERGASLLEAIGARSKPVRDKAKELWNAVPKKTGLDASGAFEQTLKEYSDFGELAKDSISGSAKSVINKVESIANGGGLTTVGDLQDIRAAAGRAMAEASGKNPTQVSLMSRLRENIDNFGLSYAYDQTVGAKGGLPGTAATATDLEALTKLSNAIEATRNVKQTYESGIVGKLTAVKQFKPKVETSRVLDKVLETPENVAELEAKFGRNSTEMTQVRMELLSRLSSQKNPTEFLGRKKDVFTTAFGSDYKDVAKYAQKVGQKAPMSEYVTITESVIPTKVFGTIESTKRFVSQFKNTPVIEMAKAKFISSKLTKSGNPIANLQANRKIANELFGADVGTLEKILKDAEVAKSPAALQKLAASGNSITSINTTALGALQSSRGIIAMMKAGKLAGAVTSGIPGWIGGAILEKIGSSREEALNALVGELLANPKLIKLAAAPATKSNVEALLNVGMQSGILAGKATASSIVDENAALEEEIRRLEQELGSK